MNTTHRITLDEPIVLPVAHRDEPVSIIGAAINWRHGWGSSPDLHVHIDGAMPRDAELEWEVYHDPKRGNTEQLWYGATDLDADLHLSRWFSWVAPSNNKGMGGASITITLRDGTQQALLGPWVGCVRDWHEPGEKPKATEVVIRDPRYGSGLSASASLPLARRLCEEMGVYLVETPYSFAPSMEKDSVVKAPNPSGERSRNDMIAAHTS